VADVLKKIGVDPDELVKIGKDAVNEKAKQLAKKALEPKAATAAQYINVSDEVFSNDTPTMNVTSTPDFTKQTATPKPIFLPLLLGGAAALYFITRKK